MRMIRLLSRLVDVLGDRLLCATAEEMVSYGTEMRRLMGIMKDISETGVDPRGSDDYVAAERDLEALKGELISKNLNYKVNVATGEVTVFPGAAPAAASQPGSLPVLPIEDVKTIMSVLREEQIRLDVWSRMNHTNETKLKQKDANAQITRVLEYHLLRHGLFWKSKTKEIIPNPITAMTRDDAELVNKWLKNTHQNLQLDTPPSTERLQEALQVLSKKGKELRERQGSNRHGGDNGGDDFDGTFNAIDIVSLQLRNALVSWTYDMDGLPGGFYQVRDVEAGDLSAVIAQIQIIFPHDQPKAQQLSNIIRRAQTTPP
jgi:hypothetical protein